MPLTPPPVPQRMGVDFPRFLRSLFCRVVTWVVIVALLLTDLPLPLAPSQSWAASVAFGPEDFVRSTGKPQAVVRTFAVANPTGPWTLCIANGGQFNQYGRVSSAVVTLNKITVVGPSAFNQTVAQISQAVTLQAINVLSVELRSAPGSGLTLTIVQGTHCQNTPPVANAGADQTVFVTQAVQLDGSGSSDADGDLLQFHWSFVSMPPNSTAVLSDSTAVKPTFVVDRPGQYVLQLIVNDGQADSAADQVIISTKNSKPVANAGPDQTVPLGLRVFLDGSKSSDADSDQLSYHWSLISQPAGSTASLDNATTASPSFIPDKAGSYTVQLIVNDGKVDSDPDTVVISTQNSKPVANAGPDQTVQVGDTVHLDGAGSSDADGDLLTYLWSFTSKPAPSTAALSDSTNPMPSFVADQAGLYVVQLIVNDGKVDSDPDTASITVKVVPPANHPPVAHAGADQNVSVGTTVHLDGGQSSDPDGDTLSFSWQFSLKPASSQAVLQNADTATPSFVADVAGPYSVQLTVSDGRGGSATDVVDITVTAVANRPPVANAGQDQTVAVGATAQLNGAASSDPDGDTLSYQWTLIGKPAGSAATLANANTATPSFVADVAGDYTAQLVVNDGKAQGTPDAVKVTAAAEAPLAVSITSPESGHLTNAALIPVTGTVDSRANTVKVNGVPATVTGATFSANVPVKEGSNTVTAVARTTAGKVGTANVTVIRDTTPPNVVIESPTAGEIVTTPKITVVGMVNDIVTGTVNQENCQVEVSGPGGTVTAVVKNRTFMVPDFPLTLGINSINAIATDTAGNDSAPFQLQITRQDPQGPQLQIVSGNDQTTVVSTTLAAPLVVKATDVNGNPLPGTAVRFEVVRNNGMLHTSGAPEEKSEVTVVTDAAGQASVEWTLGSRVGAGNNRVEASAAGIALPALFRASATPAPCDKLLTMNGENQVGVVGLALARPFEVVAVDPGGNVCEGLPVTFQVESGGGNFGGSPSLTMLTNGDGRAAAVLTLGPAAGVNNNVVTTSSPSLTGLGATFRASGVVPGPEAATRFVGVVLDNEDQPIPNAKVQIEKTNPLISSFTDANGQFVLNTVPVGSGLLFVDGATTTRPGVWPPLEFQIDVIAGIDNTLGMPVYLPELNSDGFRTVGSEDVILEMAGVEGFQLKIFANSATFPGGGKTGVMGVTQVSNDQVPMPPPGGLAPAWVLTLQPPGVRLNPPAQLTMPNANGLPPGQIIDIFSFDHDLQQFVSVGTATVQPDGATIVSDPGSGIRKSGWGHGPPPPPPPGSGSGCAGAGPCPPPPPPGSCTGLSCNDGNPCNGQEFCNPQTGQCQSGPPLSNGTPCNTPCVSGGTCQNGSCTGGTPITPPDDPTDCRDPVCQGGSLSSQPDDSETPIQVSPGDCKQEVCRNGQVVHDPNPSESPFVPQNDGGANNDCTREICIGGQVTSVANDSENPPQSPGDCLRQVCINGVPVSVNDGSDVPATPPGDCKKGICVVGVPSIVPDDTDTPPDIPGDCQQETCSPSGPGRVPNNSDTPLDIPGDCKKGICSAGTPSSVPNDSEGCDDGDPSTIDHCENGTCVGVTSTCRDSSGNPLPDGTTCADDGDICTDDKCKNGMCDNPLKPDFDRLGINTQIDIQMNQTGDIGILRKFCPNPVPRNGYTPQPDHGCGSGAIQGLLVPDVMDNNNLIGFFDEVARLFGSTVHDAIRQEFDSLCPENLRNAPVPVVVTNACNNHDICYGTCDQGNPAQKAQCDSFFQQQIGVICDQVAKPQGLLAECLQCAKAYFFAVSLLGQSAYDSAQRGACQCCPYP